MLNFRHLKFKTLRIYLAIKTWHFVGIKRTKYKYCFGTHSSEPAEHFYKREQENGEQITPKQIRVQGNASSGPANRNNIFERWRVFVEHGLYLFATVTEFCALTGQWCIFEVSLNPLSYSVDYISCKHWTVKKILLLSSKSNRASLKHHLFPHKCRHIRITFKYTHEKLLI